MGAVPSPKVLSVQLWEQWKEEGTKAASEVVCGQSERAQVSHVLRFSLNQKFITDIEEPMRKLAWWEITAFFQR